MKLMSAFGRTMDQVRGNGGAFELPLALMVRESRESLVNYAEQYESLVNYAGF